MEQRREVLELPASRTLFEHAPAVRADAVRLAVVVGLEQAADAAEAGGLEVQEAGRPGQRLDVADRVDRLVPGDPVTVAVEQLDGVVGHGGILDPCLRQRLEHATVEVGVRLHRHGRVAVEPLHVDHVDAGERRQLREQLVIPARRGIELEPQRRIHAAQRAERGEAGGVGDPHRHDEGDGLRRPADGVLQREAVLAQGEVERRALERPPAVVAGALADRLDREEVGQPQQRGELVERAPPAQPREVARTAELLDLVDLVPGDVLALALVAVPGQPDDDRDLGEPARGVAHQRARSSHRSIRRGSSATRA